MSTTHPARSVGFTLVELMIVVVIIGVLAAIAYPSYQSYIRKSKRADAHALLTEIAAREERYYSNSSPPTYTTNPTQLGYTASPAPSPDGYWSATVTATTNIANDFTITATAGGTKGHTDAQCTNITLNSLGVKGGTSGAACW